MNAGPDGAADGSSYYYTEASGHSEGAIFLLNYDGSDCLNGISSVTFSCSMYGAGMGSLHIVGGDGTERWSKSGNQGQGWLDSLDIPLAGVNSFIFRGIRGVDYKSYITKVSLRARCSLGGACLDGLAEGTNVCVFSVEPVSYTHLTLPTILLV